MGKAFFVAGTDTDVGKTFVSCALLEAANKKGLTTMGLKPLAAGCEQVDGQWQNEDAQQLIRHMSFELPYVQVNPIALQAAASPHIAASLENKNVSASRMEGICRGALMNRPDFALVEGERSLHLVNAPSPAATAALGIGELVADRVAEAFGG